MEIIIHTVSIPLLDDEFVDCHEGRMGYPFVLDASICGISTRERAESLKRKFIGAFPFPSYRLEIPRILECNSVYELLFSIGDYMPIIKSQF